MATPKEMHTVYIVQILTCWSIVFFVGARGKVGRENVALDDIGAGRGAEE